MAAPLSRMSLVALKMRRVGLDHTAILQEQQSRLLRGHVRNKGLGPLKSSAKAGQDVSRVDWFGGYQRLPGDLSTAAQTMAPSGSTVSWVVTRSTMSRTSRRPAAAMALFKARSTGCRT